MCSLLSSAFGGLSPKCTLSKYGADDIWLLVLLTFQTLFLRNIGLSSGKSQSLWISVLAATDAWLDSFSLVCTKISQICLWEASDNSQLLRTQKSFPACLLGKVALRFCFFVVWSWILYNEDTTSLTVNRPTDWLTFKIKASSIRFIWSLSVNNYPSYICSCGTIRILQTPSVGYSFCRKKSNIELPAQVLRHTMTHGSLKFEFIASRLHAWQWLTIDCHV